MRKKLAVLMFVLAAVVGTSALTTRVAAETKCPRGSHLITCPTGSWCCPNNAFCVCFP
ncbi:MAG: hypothetical protein LAO51_03635 [Acidobacteriia bacterium]|nr:hypothetical protein [Terriglobia bacterium]